MLILAILTADYMQQSSEQENITLHFIFEFPTRGLSCNGFFSLASLVTIGNSLRRLQIPWIFLRVYQRLTDAKNS